MTTAISYSEVFAWQTCKRQHYYKFILGRFPIESSDAILTGVKGHQLLQKFYELMRSGTSKEDALAAVTKRARELADATKFADFNLLKAWSLVDNFIRDTDFSSEVALVENRFLIPVSLFSDDEELAHVHIGFTPDTVLKRKGDFYDVEDAKFVQRAWSKTKLDRYVQTKLYQIFLESMGYSVSRTLLRFFNVETKKIYEHPYTLQGAERETIIRDFLSGVKEIVRFKEGPSEALQYAPRTMNYTACQGCAFVFPCTLEAQGKDASKTLQNQYSESKYDYTR